MRLRTRARYSLFPITYSLLFALAACGDEDRTQTDYTPSSDKSRTSADDTAALPARAVPVPDTLPVPSPPRGRFAITLAPLGRATARGSGQVAAVGRATSISVTLAQAARGSTYEGAVRQGFCAAMGAGVASLYPVSADSLGAGQASSDVNVPIDSLTSAPHVVVYGRGGRPEACAAIPSSAAPPPSDPTPADTTRGCIGIDTNRKPHTEDTKVAEDSLRVLRALRVRPLSEVG